MLINYVEVLQPSFKDCVCDLTYTRCSWTLVGVLQDHSDPWIVQLHSSLLSALHKITHLLPLCQLVVSCGMQLAGSGLNPRPVATSAGPHLHSRTLPAQFRAHRHTAATALSRTTASIVPCRPHSPLGNQRSRRQQRVVCQAATDLAKFANQAYLDKAAQRFKLGGWQGCVWHACSSCNLLVPALLHCWWALARIHCIPPVALPAAVHCHMQQL